jgi:predicted transcriptional regulator
MTTPKSMTDLRDESSAYLRGEIPRPDWMKVEKMPLPDIVGVLTPANMALMRLIADGSPATVAELAEMADRAPHEVARALQDLARVGFVRLVRDGMSIPPELAAHEARLDLAHGTWEFV